MINPAVKFEKLEQKQIKLLKKFNEEHDRLMTLEQYRTRMLATVEMAHDKVRAVTDKLAKLDVLENQIEALEEKVRVLENRCGYLERRTETF